MAVIGLVWLLTIPFFVIGMCTYLFGCNDIVGGQCSRYSTESMTINRIGGFLPKGNLTHTGVEKTCSLQLGQVFSSDHAMKEYTERIYPVGSIHDIQYDRFNGLCKTDTYVSNLAICGFTFFMLIIVIWVIYFWYKCNKEENNCCKSCTNSCKDCCGSCIDFITCAKCRTCCGEFCTKCGNCCGRHWDQCWTACLIRLAGTDAVVRVNEVHDMHTAATTHVSAVSAVPINPYVHHPTQRVTNIVQEPMSRV